MDGITIKSEAADTMAPTHGSKVFWTNAKRTFEAILNNICNIAPHHDLDAYERLRNETLVDALDRAEQIRSRFRYFE